jgi:hypothetical protein
MPAPTIADHRLIGVNHLDGHQPLASITSMVTNPSWVHYDHDALLDRAQGRLPNFISRVRTCVHPPTARLDATTAVKPATGASRPRTASEFSRSPSQARRVLTVGEPGGPQDPKLVHLSELHLDSITSNAGNAATTTKPLSSPRFTAPVAHRRRRRSGRTTKAVSGRNALARHQGGKR